jgi:hypothetical protein
LFYELSDPFAELRKRYFAKHDVDLAACEEEALLAFDAGVIALLLLETIWR